jgi:hypothetical protein
MLTIVMLQLQLLLLGVVSILAENSTFAIVPLVHASCIMWRGSHFPWHDLTLRVRLDFDLTLARHAFLYINDAIRTIFHRLKKHLAHSFTFGIRGQI